MSILGAVGSFFGSLFGSSSNGKGKGIVQEVSDVADQWHPSAVTQHKMEIEDETAGDNSQKNAQQLQIPYHDSWFDIFVDGLNRLVRPVTTYWVLGGLAGLWRLPLTDQIDPMMMNIAWTVITFWFGSRVIFKDIPAAYRTAKKLINK